MNENGDAYSKLKTELLMCAEAAVGESQCTRVAQGRLQAHAEGGGETDPLGRDGQGRSVVVGDGSGQLKLLHRRNQVS